MKHVILILSFLISCTVSANPVPDFPFVIVTENLDKKVKPDLAKINFTLLAYDNSSVKTMESLTGSSALILDLLEEKGISISSLESSQVDKTIKRARKEGVYGLEILGYEMTQDFVLTLNDLDIYPSVMNALIKLDGVQGADALFETTKEDVYKEEMILDLSIKARKKADMLAEAQSKKVKSVYGITTEGNFGQAYAIFSLEYDPEMYALGMRGGSNEGNLIMTVPEYIEVAQQITAIYKLK